jgi:hypothetical protein
VTNRARQPRDPARNTGHPIDADAHGGPEDAVEAERHRDEAGDSHRHRPERHDRHCDEIGDDAIRRQAMKMIGREQRGGETGEQ